MAASESSESGSKPPIEQYSTLAGKRSGDNSQCLENSVKKPCDDIARSILLGGGDGIKQLEEYLSVRAKPPQLHSQFIYKPR